MPPEPKPGESVQYFDGMALLIKKHDNGKYSRFKLPIGIVFDLTGYPYILKIDRQIVNG